MSFVTVVLALLLWAGVWALFGLYAVAGTLVAFAALLCALRWAANSIRPQGNKMSKPKRKYAQYDDVRAQMALRDLRRALFMLKCIGAKRTADKVRRAIKSAGGAERHVLRLMREQERGE